MMAMTAMSARPAIELRGTIDVSARANSRVERDFACSVFGCSDIGVQS